MDNIYDHIVGSMKFKQNLPHFALREYIYNYSFVEGNSPPANTSMQIISNGYIELFMHFDGSFICIDRKNTKYNLNNYIIGINNNGNTIRLEPGKSSQKLNGLIVRFTHRGVNELLGVKISNLCNEIVSSEEIWGYKGKQLFNVLFDTTEICEKKEILDDFFLAQLTRHNEYHRIDLDLISRICNEKNQRATVENLADSLYLSYRTLSRKFENETGICPKEYMKIVRINKICQVINERKAINLPEILYYGGYYDQSHFIREFRATLNITPNELLKNSNGNFYVTRGVRIN
ncbi:AraC family transcriptional regulator [bacterium]|nr:MAG: AraC family transcriptional regulator [bacterium]